MAYVDRTEFGPNPTEQPTASRATRPEVASTFRLRADAEAVQAEARHKATTEAVARGTPPRYASRSSINRRGRSNKSDRA